MSTFLSSVLNFISTVGISDILDIFVVSYAFYKIACYIKGSRAMFLIKGIGLLLIVLWASQLLQLNTVNFILRNTMQVGLVAVLVVFQPELRRALEQVGRTSISKFFQSDADIEQTLAQEISSAAKEMSKTKTGALIVLERNTKLSEIAKTGIALDSLVSQELLLNIFSPRTPLHDGAVLISDNRIAAAGCLLPLTDNSSLGTELGTRHRAALGISENSDAVVIVVSEETGNISIAIGGNLTRSLSEESLKKIIIKNLYNTQEDSKSNNKWKEAFNWKSQKEKKS